MRNQKGFALILVLGALVVLTTIAVEFAYKTRAAYDVASARRDRLQAYYLARSALQLGRLELKGEKQLRAQIASLLQELPRSGVTSDPLCKQLPLSTGFIQGIASGALLDGLTGQGEEEAKEEEAAPVPEERGEGFLNFEGDFEMTCDTEERKINLNLFRADPAPVPGSVPPGNPTAASSLYEEQKTALFSLMSQKEFEPIFGDKPDEIRKVVNAIADWADRDDRINEAPGVSGSDEGSLYEGPDVAYKIKNGKFTSLPEILLVAGVGDDLYRLLSDNLTVYGDSRINLCQASDQVIKAFVARFAQGRLGGVSIPLDYADEQRWTAVTEAVRQACDTPSPQPAQVANAVAGALGLTNAAGMAGQITTTNRFYRLEAVGNVKESEVKIIAVLDTGQANPQMWKTLYYRVE